MNWNWSRVEIIANSILAFCGLLTGVIFILIDNEQTASYWQQRIDGYGYSQFCFHLQQQQIASKPSMYIAGNIDPYNY